MDYRIIPMITAFVLLAFWIWMFRDMTVNDHLLVTSKYNWMLAFIFLNVFAAVYYYVYEYRKK